MTEEQFKDLRDAVEAARADAEQAKGAIEELRRQLQALGCGSQKQAERALLKLKALSEQLERELDQAVLDYKKRWKT